MATNIPTSAKAIVQQFLDQYGLGQLGNWAWNLYKSSGGGDAAFGIIRAELPQQAAFKARFPAYDALAKAGKAMSVDQMLAYEQQARQIFHDAGLPASFYDSPDDFAKFMVNDVSASELQSRVQIAQQAVVSSPPAVRQQLEQLYGIKAGDLTAYWLDPNKAMPVLQQRYTSAQIGGQAATTGFGQLDRATAELLAQQGVTNEQAQQGFGQLAENKGLFDIQQTGETAIDQQTQIGATFSNDAAARLRIKRRQESRTAAFGGSSGFGVGQKGVAGLGASDTSAY